MDKSRNSRRINRKPKPKPITLEICINTVRKLTRDFERHNTVVRDLVVIMDLLKIKGMITDEEIAEHYKTLVNAGEENTEGISIQSEGAGNDAGDSGHEGQELLPTESDGSDQSGESTSVTG